MEIVQASSRTGPKRPCPPTGMLIHHAGLGVNARAEKVGMEPEALAVSIYRSGTAYPDALIGHKRIHLFAANDMIKTAHAAWRPWERQMYRRAWDDQRTLQWAHDYRDETFVKPASFYQDWFYRWQGEGRYYTSPIEIIQKIGGRPRSSPNGSCYGVELLMPVTDEQLQALAELFVSKAREHAWFDPGLINPEALPQPWLCGHDDVCPARRWKRVRGSKTVGEGWDPGPRFDWMKLGKMILEKAAR